MKKLITFLFVGLFVFTVAVELSAQQLPSEIEKAQLDINKEKKLRERLEQKKQAPEIEDKEKPQQAPASTSQQKVLIKKIDVLGVTLLREDKINKITSQYENQDLSMADMQKVADLITDAYRKKGYITSRAYLPPQKIEQNTVEIRVMEGAMGNVEIKGNRYFKTKLLRKKITLAKGEPFNYDILKSNLSKLNEHPDRKTRAVLMPGKEPGTTDIVLEVKDKLPIHFGLDWDNYGSRYISKNRYRGTITHNNLLGFDDILTLQYQKSERNAYWLSSARYLLPLTDDFSIGAYGARSRVTLGKEFEEMDARAKSRLYGIYTIHSIIQKEDFSLNFNLGFDYKDVFNFFLGDETSRDRLRIGKAGVDIDATDKFGRTIITQEIGYGIPGIMGGLETRDPHASREGAGGKFVKNTLNLLRLQKLPFDSILYWKNQLQFSPYILPSTEQFQIGGVANVRGYPPAEVVGDQGYAMTWELSLPVYFIPKSIKVPLSEAKLYDSVRVALFYDWANTRLRRPQPGEEKNKTLRGAGVGVRVYLPEDFSTRVDFAWPLDNTPSDGNHLHTWFEISKAF